MDTDQQVQLNFLEESSEYFDQIEQVLLGLATAESKSQQLDIALRAAHSIKGSAGMMGFPLMGQVAHRLEDFFKILRARHVAIDEEIETLLLRAIDCLKEIRERLVDQQTVDEAWVSQRTQPIFEGLRSRLGDLTDEDEDSLLAGEEEIDVALLIFNNGVDEILGRFEAEVEQLTGEALREALVAAASQLSNLGLMGEMDAFVSLCASVQAQAATVGPSQIQALVAASLKGWQRSQSLVQLGRTEKLPTEVSFVAIATDPALSLPLITGFESPESFSEEASQTSSGEFFQEALDANELAALQAEMAAALGQIAIPEEEALSSPASAVPGFDLSLPDLSQLQDAIAQIELLPSPDLSPGTEQAAAAPPLDSTPLDGAPLDITASSDRDRFDPFASETNLSREPKQAMRSVTVRPNNSQLGGTLRVSADDLQQINTLFGTLVLERNAIDLRQQQLLTFAALLQERMNALETFNMRLRQWYDRASMEGLTAPSQPLLTASSPFPADPDRSGAALAVTALQLVEQPALRYSPGRDFDALEMDQYSELHLLAQEQMETVVQLQEVNADIQLGLQEMGQAIQQLNGSTHLLQGRIVRTQMRPFSDVVSRFPRVIRDLSVQYDKKVDLKIEGETTLIERVALDALTDPLNHLLRNSFDHGIETAAERLEAGKSPRGTITLRASQQGNQVRIAVSDDGRGINLDKIRDRVRKHDIPEEHIAQMSERELLSLIFDAGFSTAEKVTELSGRGVGMDVVRANIEKLNGDIQIETRLGEGTTFKISIPLNLSVLRVMLLEQRRMTFAVPVDAIEEMILNQPGLVVRSPDQLPYILWNNRQVPVEDVTENFIFRSQSEPIALEGNPSISQPLLVIIRDGDRYQAIPIERFWREQEVAVRPVMSPMPMPTGFAGATVLGNGQILPLIDLVQLLRSAGEYRDLARLEAELAVQRSEGQGQEEAREFMAIETTFSSSAIDIDELTKDFTRQTVLIIDDSIHVRRYVTATLERAGYDVEQAKDGQEGVDKLLGGLQVCAVLCDVEMPRLDGYGVLDEIKSRPEFATLPITMLTSRNSVKHRKLAMNLGASAYFSKPYNEQELLQSLANLIQS